MRTARQHIRSFGVLEIIVSVAILAAFSVFVLRLFVQAKNDMEKTRQLDEAVRCAVTYAEDFKNSASPFELLGGAEMQADRLSKSMPAGGGLRAEISIYKDSANAAGAVYAVEVDMLNGAGERVYRLRDLKFFSRVK